MTKNVKAARSFDQLPVGSRVSITTRKGLTLRYSKGEDGLWSEPTNVNTYGGVLPRVAGQTGDEMAAGCARLGRAARVL